jgi:hypothetical protein
MDVPRPLRARYGPNVAELSTYAQITDLRGGSTLSRTSWPAITLTMRPAPTCCAGWARSHKSRAAYDQAIELAGNTAEIASLTRRRDQLG